MSKKDIPDYRARMLEAYSDNDAVRYFLAIRDGEIDHSEIPNTFMYWQGEKLYNSKRSMSSLEGKASQYPKKAFDTRRFIEYCAQHGINYSNVRSDQVQPGVLLRGLKESGYGMANYTSAQIRAIAEKALIKKKDH